MIVGPGSLWVQEAKRQVAGVVGIDGFAGPSDLTVIASEGADVEALSSTCAAQAEHGDGSLTVAVSDDQAILDGLEATSKVLADDMEAALAFAEALAPEHLQLAGAEAEALARASAPPAACSSATPRAPRSATTSRAPTTRCRPRAPRASPRASTSATSGAAWPRSGCTTPRPRWRAAGVPIAEAEGFAAHAASMALRQNPRP